MDKTIAFFDFDGTITTQDTMLELARFSAGNTNYWLGMVKLSPGLVAMKFSLLSKEKAKERFLKYFFGGKTVGEFDELCRLFTAQRLPLLIKKEALSEINRHHSAHTPVVIVSASGENWVAPWCRQNNIQCIATRLEIRDDKITGLLDGKNCNGIEKVSRIKACFNLADFNNIYCYGDTNGDKPMLALATKPFYRVFK